MSSHASSKIIGAFVLGAVALVIAAILIFGTGRFFAKTLIYVLYFQDSVDGLDIGAPVKLRGVQVGRVSQIRAIYDSKTGEVLIPVFVEVDPRHARDPDSMTDVPTLERVGEVVEQLVKEKGLRAQLQLQSLVTGKLFIELDFHPGTRIRLVGGEQEYPELPTVRSKSEQALETIESVVTKIESIPLEDLINKVYSALEGFDQLVSAPEILQTVHTLDTTLKEINVLMKNIDAQIKPLSVSMRTTIDSAGKLVHRLDQSVVPLVADIHSAVDEAQSALEQTRKTMASAEKIVGERSVLQYELTKTLQQLTSAARSIRVMADYLERHPDALLYGKRRGSQ